MAGDDSRRAERAFELVNYARRTSARLPGQWDRHARDLGKAILNYRGARHSYARHALFAVLRRGSDVLLAPFGDAQLLVRTDDREIGRVVFATGGYERVYMECAVAELTRLGFPVDGKTFVDVGANIGTSTIDALVHFGYARALCFEPDERSFRLLLANVALNGLESRVEAHPVALSSTNGLSLLEISSTNWADNRLVTEEEAPSPRSEQVVGIECRRFDALVAEGTVSLDEIGVIWLDAQGHEPLVLEGAAAAMEAGIPLVMEYTPGALQTNGTLDDLEAMIRANYTTVIDLHLLAAGLGSQAVMEAARMSSLRDNLDREHTDLLIVRSQP